MTAWAELAPAPRAGAHRPAQSCRGCGEPARSALCEDCRKVEMAAWFGARRT